MEILILNGHDYSPYIERAGYGWGAARIWTARIQAARRTAK